MTSFNRPLITILVPCYNVEKYVDECLSSIQKQTYDNLEVLCINDGSTDNTLNILRKYEASDNRFHIINKSNSGYGASMNIGLNKASGDYIGIVESDDFSEPQMFEKLIRAAIENDLDIARSCYFEYKTRDNTQPSCFQQLCPEKYCHRTHKIPDTFLPSTCNMVINISQICLK